MTLQTKKPLKPGLSAGEVYALQFASLPSSSLLALQPAALTVQDSPKELQTPGLRDQGATSQGLGRHCRSSLARVQEVPKVEKQAKWGGSPKPQDNKWDDVIQEAVTRGQEVPEITWAEPGVDAASKVPVWRT